MSPQYAFRWFMIFGLCSALAWCQGNLGGLSGTITDASGAAVPDASVQLTNIETSATYPVTSTAAGLYSVVGVTPGRYRLVVTKPGFQTYRQEPIVIATETVSTQDISLRVGSVNESVVVSSDAQQLQTDSAEIGTVMQRQQLLDLPISLGGTATIGASGRRQIESFIFLTPGVVGNQWSKSINGAPGFSQEILYDGLDAQNIGAPGFIADSTPPYEAVEEFKVQNTLYPAQYGLGYGVLNFTLRSGTNQFHGDLFEFLRNDKLDARGFFTDVKPPIRQNNYGGTFGGPVIIPKLYNGKDKTFFFFAYDGFQLRGGLPPGGQVTIPSLAERSGNFSDFPYPIFDPATTTPDGAGGFVRQPFPNNQIPASRISAVASRLIPLLPSPINTSYFNNYIDHSFQPTSENNWSIKADQIITDKQRLSFSYWKTSADITVHGPIAGELDPQLRRTPTSGGGLRANYIDTISATLVNHIGFGYTPVSPTWAHWLSDPRHGNATLQIPGIPADAPGYPQFNFDQLYNQLGNAPNQGFDPVQMRDWALADDLNWTKGRHQLKFGLQYRLRTQTVGDFDNEAGSFNFDARSTSQPNDPNFNNWGNAFASLLLGQVFSATRSIPPPINHFRDTFWGFYAEDSFKANNRLTITLGLRYELPFLVRERDGLISLFNPALPNPGAGGRLGALEFLGTGPGRTGSTNIFGPTYLKAFSPRAALAYAIDGKTVARLGYGTFYIYPNYGRIGAGGCGLAWCQGFGALPSVSTTDSGVTPAFLLDNGFPATNVTAPNFDPTIANNGAAAYINPSVNKPALQQSWTVDIQRQLPFAMMLDTAYVGSHTVRLWTGLENINQVNPRYLSLGNTLYADINSPDAAAAGVALPYPGFSGSVAQALRPYPQYTTLYDTFQPTGGSTYNALQVRLEKRFSAGLSIQGAYTFSKALGTAGGDTFGDPSGGGGSRQALDTFNRSIEKSLLPFDQTHTFVLAWTYELPFGRGKRFLSNVNGVLNQVVGGWQLNSIESYHTGGVISISGGTDIPLFGGGNRPNWISPNVRSSVPMSNFDPATDLYLNASAFSQPAPFTFGNAPPFLPNVRTPFFYNEDLSIFKKFPFAGEYRFLEIRAEMFDVLNRVVFGGPSTNLNNLSTFGTIGSQANTPRVIQFGAKLVF